MAGRPFLLPHPRADLRGGGRLGTAYTNVSFPWAGVIYRPNQYWQLDLTFPQAHISTYLWDEFGFKTSLYGRVEYHSEAYEIYNPVLDQRDRVQLDDWRALIGINKDRVDVAYFVEAGWNLRPPCRLQSLASGLRRG